MRKTCDVNGGDKFAEATGSNRSSLVIVEGLLRYDWLRFLHNSLSRKLRPLLSFILWWLTRAYVCVLSIASHQSGPDDSPEAVDLINSLREYDLCTARMRRDGPGGCSLPVPRSAPEYSESLPLSPPPPPPPPPPSSCTSPVRPVGAPSAAARGAIAAALRPVALASMGNSEFGDKSLVGHGAAAQSKGVWGDEDAKASAKGPSEKVDVREGDEKDSVDEGKKDERRGESMADGGRANGKVDSLGRMEDLGVDMEDLGIGHGQPDKGQRIPGPGRGQRGNRKEDDGWSNLGIPGLWDYIPDNAAVAAAASETYRKQEASAAVGACLVSSSVRKDGKVRSPSRGYLVVTVQSGGVSTLSLACHVEIHLSCCSPFVL